MRTTFAVIQIVAILAIGHTVASACSCVPRLTAEEALAADSAVFVGWVTEIETSDTSHKYDPSLPWPENERRLAENFMRRTVTFAVTHAWKGVAEATVAVRTGVGRGDCGFQFEIGESYLVYASETQLGLKTGICHRTAAMSCDLGDLKVLGDPSYKRTWAAALCP